MTDAQFEKKKPAKKALDAIWGKALSDWHKVQGEKKRMTDAMLAAGQTQRARGEEKS